MKNRNDSYIAFYPLSYFPQGGKDESYSFPRGGKPAPLQRGLGRGFLINQRILNTVINNK
jgi:hypothetical protein